MNIDLFDIGSGSHHKVAKPEGEDVTNGWNE